MSANINIDLSGLDRKLGGQSLRRAQYILVNQVLSDMYKFVPYKSGNLANDTAIGIDGKSIIYTVPYAKAQFYGFITNYKTGKQYRIRNYTQLEGRMPSRRWDLRAKSLYSDVWENKVKKSLLEGM